MIQRRNFLELISTIVTKEGSTFGIESYYIRAEVFEVTEKVPILMWKEDVISAIKVPF